MKKNLLFSIMLLTTCITLAQTDYRSLLVRGNRSYWANPYTVCNSGNFDIYFSKQTGIYFDSTGIFDRYTITDDNDTINERYDTEFSISHRTYELKNDTIVLTAWFEETDFTKMDNGMILEAYKILYLTDHRLVLLQLRSDGAGGWSDENPIGDCSYLFLHSFMYMDP